METILNLILGVAKWIGIGFVVLIAIIIIFGNRVKKLWEYEAEFRNEKGREFGEFEIEKSKIEKKEADYTIKVEFKLRDERLTLHQTVQVYLDDELMMEGMVTNAGRVYFGKEQYKGRIDEPPVGRICRVVVGGTEILRQEMLPDNVLPE